MKDNIKILINILLIFYIAFLNINNLKFYSIPLYLSKNIIIRIIILFIILILSTSFEQGSIKNNYSFLSNDQTLNLCLNSSNNFTTAFLIAIVYILTIYYSNMIDLNNFIKKLNNNKNSKKLNIS
jgi:hypothetical protein